MQAKRLTHVGHYLRKYKESITSDQGCRESVCSFEVTVINEQQREGLALKTNDYLFDSVHTNRLGAVGLPW